MASRGMRWILASAAALALSGCDSFSLTGRLAIGDPVSLSAAKTTAQRGEAIALTVTGGTAPFSFSVAAQDLYPGTDEESIGGVFNQVYSAGTAIGRIAITVTDAADTADTVYIVVVPPTPSLTVAWQGFFSVLIKWTYTVTGAIDGFRIHKSVDGGSFNDFGWFDNLYTQIIDEDVPFGHSYKYRIYAVSGSYFSIPEVQDL